MQMRTILVIALAVVFGLSAAAGVNIFLNAQTVGGAAPAEETVDVVVAVKDISRFHTVTADVITTRPIPKSLAPQGALNKVEDALERVTLHKVNLNEMILDSQLAKKGSGLGVAAATPDGKRAFTIKTNKISGAVAGFVLPGDRVDVLLTVTPAMESRQHTLTLTLLTNIEVLAVDQVTEPNAERKNTDDLKTVTLVVTPEQASKLALGENKGSLHLSLRNPNDTTEVGMTKITLQDIGLEPEVREPAPAPKKEEPKKEEPKPKPAPVKVAPPKLPPPKTLRMIYGGTVEGKYTFHPTPAAQQAYTNVQQQPTTAPAVQQQPMAASTQVEQ